MCHNVLCNSVFNVNFFLACSLPNHRHVCLFIFRETYFNNRVKIIKMKEQKPSQEPNGRTQIHNVRFYNLTPRSILCMGYNRVWHKLALSRNDGSIEIWDMEHAPFLELTIPKSPENSVEGLAWAGERLFSAGLSGEIVEWNLQTLRPLRKQHATGNAIWCLDINPNGTELAVATEEGYINIFDITGNQLVYKMLFDKQEGRILCCKFDASGEFLVTGSMGAIRIWDVKSGHALHKMTVARAEKKKEVIVWSVQVLRDFTIISGDSRGQFTMWDGKTATFVESHQVLAADVLALVINEEENLVICSGIEPIIRIYAKTKTKRDDMVFFRWVKFLQRRVHDHDVKALVCVGDRILSGGMDGYLGISSSSKMQSKIVKYGPFLQNPCVVLAAQCKLVMLRYSNYLEVWRLGSSSGKQEFQLAEDGFKPKYISNLLSLDTTPEKLLEFKSKGGEPIVCATISPDGRWLCYSTQEEIRLFRFEHGVPGGTQLSRVKVLPEQFVAATHAHFTSDSKRLFLVNGVTKQILIFKMLPNDTTDLDFTECIETEKHIKNSISMLTVSACGTYVVAIGICRSIAVWHVFKGKYFKHYLNLPRYTAPITAISMHPEKPCFVAAFSDGKIFEYDLEEMCFICSDKDYFVSSVESHCINNIVMDTRNPSIIILQNDASLFVLEKCPAASIAEEESSVAPLPNDSKEKGSRRKSLKKAKRVDDDTKVARLRLKFEKTYEHLIHLSCLSPHELVAVGVNPVSLLEQLPGAYKQKMFGVA